MIQHRASGMLVAHGIACLAALVFAWAVSRTAFVTTGVQFIAPLLVIMLVHFVWEGRKGLSAVQAERVLVQTMRSSVVLATMVAGLQIVAPMPTAASGDVMTVVLSVLFCLAVLAAVLAVVAGVLLIAYRLLRWLFRRARGGGDVNELGSLAIVFAGLGLASLEGVDGAYRFASAGQATATRDIDVPDPAVWAAMETATSPAFPLPGLLAAFPQPVAVEQDEGVSLGARRAVRFSGREGSGVLRLIVDERTPSLVRFVRQSDSSPVANWIGIEAISYRITPSPTGTQISLTLDFERKLAPALVFDPMMKGAAWLAMDVLARDVAARATH